MIRDDQDLQEIEEFLRIAESLACAQEVEIHRMRQAELDVKHAEGLLSAYREALRLAQERHQALKNRLRSQQPAADAFKHLKSI
jgi:hypothetical protein